MPHMMFGFRRRVSAQDIFLILKEEVLNPPSGSLNNIVLALDVHKAFDTISHETILQGLEDIGCGQRIYHYVQTFLSNRTAILAMGAIKSNPLSMPNKGTPQGSVLSPFLFNVGLRRLAITLNHEPRLGFAMYADDITLWTTQGSYGERQDTLQTALSIVEDYLEKAGMSCAPAKSEYIHIRPYKSRSRRAPELTFYLGGSPLRRVNTLRILGMYIQETTSVKVALDKLRYTVKSLTGLIRRISRGNNSMTEHDTLSLVQALVLSRLTYALPYQTTRKTEQEQADILIRLATKAALGLPTSTSTQHLLALGVHNTFEELAAATLISQRERLCGTPQGKFLLQRLGFPISPQYCSEATDQLSQHLRQHIVTQPIPRNMHPYHHRGRRIARVQKLQRLKDHPDVYYTDVSPYPKQQGQASAFALAVVNRGKLVNSATIFTSTTAAAEATAIALAIRMADQQGISAYVVSDSQAACRMYIKGILPTRAIQLLGSELLYDHGIVWCPAHTGQDGNELVHCQARVLSGRAPRPPATEEDTDDGVPRRGILDKQRLDRRIGAPPHKDLDRQQARDWRRLQTDTFPNLHKLHLMYPDRYPNACPWCGDIPTLSHITYRCPERPATVDIGHTHPIQTWSWEARLAERTLGSQLVTLGQARRAAIASGALQEGPHPR
uniref:Putative tick transposon n=1 Tax=Rhipicephalus pulchellus TaxID=72859 RepID=L7M2Q4_RHIPC